MPPDKRKGAPGGGAPSSKSVAADQSDCPHNSFSLDRAQLRPRPIGPGELAALRAIFWRQAAQGHRLPAELGVIVLDGGAI